MTIIEYLKNEALFSLDLNGNFKLQDIIDSRSVYCKGYNTLIEELSLNGLEHVKNARFIGHKIEDSCNIILYIKDIQEYSNFELMQVAEKLYSK